MDFRNNTLILGVIMLIASQIAFDFNWYAACIGTLYGGWLVVDILVNEFDAWVKARFYRAES